VALDDYRKKRDFTKSPEPAGDAAPKRKKTAAPLFFCVQKHLASHLHYDLRLEWNGVLLSWAVPKGPSIDSRDKRLAMHVEDHPLEYGTFEGVIPEGYGAGIVMLWDVGTWEPEVDVDSAFRKGDLKFRLNGYKLKGSWVLVKTHGFGGAPNSWLLIKHKDDWSGPIDIAEFAPLSVKTPNADFAEILQGQTPDLWLHNPPAKTGDTGQVFKKIIERALTMRAPKDQGAKAPPPRPKAASARSRRSSRSSSARAKADAKKR
jgi:DNA ligase D-like protein (predicted 3'-phosphoesterase)